MRDKDERWIVKIIDKLFDSKDEAGDIRSKNNKREKLINSENESIYTDMALYLMGSNIGEYKSELVKADLIEMIIDAQERGENIKDLFGNDYKAVCDEIIASIGEQSRKEKILENIEVVLAGVKPLLIMFILFQLIVGLDSVTPYRYELTLGELITFTLFTIVGGVTTFKLVKETLFKQNKNKLVYLKWFIMIVIFSPIISMPYIFLDNVILNISIMYPILFLVGLLILEKIFKNKKKYNLK